MRKAWGSSYGAYINYSKLYDICTGVPTRAHPRFVVDPRLSPTDTKQLYWGSQYPRLSALKKKYDAHALFRNAQSIQPAT